ncbi:MAG TPA: amino acid ABC transporter permease [Mycobacteriales bacterium]|nr:amino acid ABC transporter permease [Mycobacteriales bacterium]
MSSQVVLYDVPGPRARRRVLIGSLVGLLLLGALLALLLRRFADNGQLEPEVYRPFLEQPLFWERLGDGLRNTLKAAAYGLVLALVLGFVLAAGRLSQSVLLRVPATVVVEFFRATPLLLLILAIFLAYPILVGSSIDPLWALVAGLTLYNGAVIAEIVRAGVQALPKGQTEAALAVGLSRGQTLRVVLLPQAVRIMLPALVSQLVVLLKDTSLGFIIAYEELLRTSRFLVEAPEFSRSSLQVFLVIAVIYVVINLLLGRLAAYLEGRQRKQFGGGTPQVETTTL